jgi:hypothetical protein
MEAKFRALLCYLLTGRAGYCFHHLVGGGIAPYYYLAVRSARSVQYRARKQAADR